MNIWFLPILVDRIYLLVHLDSAGLPTSPGGVDHQVPTPEPDGARHSVRRVAGRKVWRIMSQNQVRCTGKSSNFEKTIHKIAQYKYKYEFTVPVIL